MTQIVSYEDAREAKRCERQAEIVGGLEELLRRTQAGEFRGICYCCIGKEGEGLWVGAFSEDGVGAHELVGASAILTDHILRAGHD